MTKIAIGLPTNRLIKPKTAKSLLEMAYKTKHDLHFIVSVKGYTTAENRNYISSQAVKNKCSHLFYADDDMIYEEDTINKMVERDKDIIGGIYYTKYNVQDDLIEYIGEKKEGLFECGALGGGLMMIKTKILEKIPTPWFGYIWHKVGMIKESNDWYFCHNAKDAGFKVYCDTDIKAKHIGNKIY